MHGSSAEAVTNPALEVVEAAALGGRAAQWDALVETAPLSSAFLTSWWLDAAAAHALHPLFLLVHDGADLVGGLALDEHGPPGLRRVRLLGEGPLAPDHLDLLAAPAREAEVTEALATWFEAWGPGLVDLRGVAAGARLLDVLPGRPFVTVVSDAPHLTLEGEAPPRPIQGGTNLGRQARRLARDGVTYRTVDGHDARELDRALVELRRLHLERWDRRTGFVRGFTAIEQAVRAGAPTGAVRVHELVSEGEVVASELTFDVGGRRHMYQSGRSTEHRWRGVGNVLHLEAIRDAWARGMHEYDFLRGREPYKYRWTSQARPVLRVRAAVGPVPVAVLWVAATAELGRPPARRVKAWARRVWADRRPARRPRSDEPSRSTSRTV